MYGTFLFKNELFSTWLLLHVTHRVPLRFVQDEQTILEQITQDLLPNLDPHISQFLNWKNIVRLCVIMFYIV